jgi:hypothetical protein
VPPIFVLTGKVKGDDRKELIEQIKALPASVIFATV